LVKGVGGVEAGHRDGEVGERDVGRGVELGPEAAVGAVEGVPVLDDHADVLPPRRRERAELAGPPGRPGGSAPPHRRGRTWAVRATRPRWWAAARARSACPPRARPRPPVRAGPAGRPRCRRTRRRAGGGWPPACW